MFSNLEMILTLLLVISTSAYIYLNSKLLREKKLEFSELFSGIEESAIVSITDEFGKINYVNKKFIEISGFSREELIGADHRLINSGHHPKEFFNEMWAAIISGKVWHGDICNMKKDGTKYWVSTVISQSKTSVGKNQYMSIRFDISEMKLAQLQVAQSSKLASLGEMAAGMAHEINNPLSIIAGSLKQLTRSLDNPEKFSQTIQVIQKSTDRISKIVRGLKKFSRISDENCFLNCSIELITKEAMTLTEPKAKNEATIVTCEIQDNFYIFCDEIAVEQVLINLINNAIDAVKKTENPWVKIQVLSESQEVLLRVYDSGLGIPEKIRAKLFDPFFTTKIAGEGTGLGLSLTKGILDQHNATISVLPHEKNTCFEIRFPKIEVISE